MSASKPFNYAYSALLIAVTATQSVAVAQSASAPQHVGPGIFLAQANSAGALPPGGHPLQELQRQWESLAMGTTPEQVVLRLGVPPLEVDNQAYLGVTLLTYTWKDAWGGKWSASFINNLLFRKVAQKSA